MKQANQTIESASQEACLTFKQKLRRLFARHGVLGLCAGVLALGATGCSMQGGGWIPSRDGVSGDKATFGFDITNVISLNNDNTNIFYGNAIGDLTVQDRNYISDDFPSGVNVHAGTNWFIIGMGSGLNDFLTNTFGPEADVCDVFTNVFGPIFSDVFGTNVFGTNAALSEFFCGTNNIALAVSKCTFARGGNGGQPGTLVAFGMDTGQTGAYKGDQVGFIIYPYVELDSNGNIDPTFAAYVALFTLIYPEAIPGEAIYANVGTIGDGGPGGGNLTVTVNGEIIPIDLGPSWVSLGVLGALIAGALAWRRRLRPAGSRV